MLAGPIRSMHSSGMVIPERGMQRRLLVICATFALAMSALSCSDRGGESSSENLEWTPTQWTSNREFRLTVTSRLDPPLINMIHEWEVRVEDSDGQPVQGAQLVLDGGMPAHQHGLPSQPKMTEELGDGLYLIEGVKYSMPGHWEMRLSVTLDDRSDEAVFNLVL